MEEPDPEKAPSGKEANGYGEVMIRIWITDEGAEATVSGDPKMPFDFYVVAAEHLMTLVGTNSKAGYKKAIDLLVEGAMSNKGVMIKTIEEEEDDETEEDL